MAAPHKVVPRQNIIGFSLEKAGQPLQDWKIIAALRLPMQLTASLSV